MKHLRILTGAHAGVQIRLDRDAYVVSKDHDADLRISDWKHAPIRLTVEAGRPVTLHVCDSDAKAGAPLGTLEDLMPRRFNDIILCTGSADAAWPPDYRLLEKMLRAPKRDASKQSKGHGWRAPALCGAAALLLASALLSIHAPSAEANAVQSEPLARRVAKALYTAGASGLTVRKEGERVSVEGMVADEASAARVRTVLLPFAPDVVTQKFSAATDIERAIADALANPGLSVHYRGDGVFVVTGSSVDMDKVRGMLRRIANDLGPAVARIDVEAQDIPPPGRLPAGAVLSSGNLEYVQTRDGTKHLVITGVTATQEPATRH